MGYSVYIDIENVVIPKENVEACLKAVNDLSTKEYKWVDVPDEKFTTLSEAFDHWTHTGDEINGDFHLTDYEGEKWGNGWALLYKAIAPYVKSGGSITVEGEDFTKWGYDYEDGKIYEVVYTTTSKRGKEIT